MSNDPSSDIAPNVPAGERVIHVTGTVHVPMACPQAFELFTPHGERAWAHGWNPLYPAPTPDDSVPGTVFQIVHGAERATWVVCQCETGRSIQYARVLPGTHAGTISVILHGDDSTCVATVEYRLTALTDEAAHQLHHFAAHYPAFLREWEVAIARVYGGSDVGSL